MQEYYSSKQAHEHAEAWCAKHPAWLQIHEVADTDQYYVQWSELSAAQKKYWESEYGYNEFATKARKIPMGFITGKGEFFEDVCAVPFGHNLMMVLKVGVVVAREIRAGAAVVAARPVGRPSSAIG